MKRELCSNCGRRAMFEGPFGPMFRERDMCHVNCTECPRYAPGRGAFLPLKWVRPGYSTKTNV